MRSQNLIRHQRFDFAAKAVQQSLFGNDTRSKIQVLANFSKRRTRKFFLRLAIDPVRHHVIGDHDSKVIRFGSHHFSKRQVIRGGLVSEPELRSVHCGAWRDGLLIGTLHEHIGDVSLQLQIHHAFFVKRPQSRILKKTGRRIQNLWKYETTHRTENGTGNSELNPLTAADAEE